MVRISETTSVSVSFKTFLKKIDLLGTSDTEEKIIDDLQKNTNVAERQEAKDLENAANLIINLREGKLDADAVAKALEKIAEEQNFIKK
jgi:hypothetical protein